MVTLRPGSYVAAICGGRHLRRPPRDLSASAPPLAAPRGDKSLSASGVQEATPMEGSGAPHDPLALQPTDSRLQRPESVGWAAGLRGGDAGWAGGVGEGGEADLAAEPPEGTGAAAHALREERPRPADRTPTSPAAAPQMSGPPPPHPPAPPPPHKRPAPDHTPSPAPAPPQATRLQTDHLCTCLLS
ncbi:basic proline-rich protein-like [Zalophus californianus]|uniref:Basic proline-rich protein-like n=1 Tax=Zalophus californianus TaxID=9704 RepID=A0A6J2FQG7_ZALCA|nr:basic proline-rich protein-like [Zalophus californianus]